MLKVQIITPERSLPVQDAVHVTMMTVDGEVGIRTGHAPLVAGLKTGCAMVRGADGKTETWLALRNGTALVLRDEVRVYVESAVDAATIDVPKIQRQLETLRSTEAKDELQRTRNLDDAAWSQVQLTAAERQQGHHAH